MLGIAAALALVAAQGQAVELAYSDESGLASVEAAWEGHRFTLVKHDTRWIAVIGVDLAASSAPLRSLAVGQALLLRPDAHIAAVLAPSDSGYADALRAALDQLGLTATVEESYGPTH